MERNGAQIIVECLLEQGVDTVFGFPGGAVLYIYDALYEYSDRIRHILSSHEQGASHAADGYARATGKVGVVIATSGPGATNIVTGIATAYMDSVPMVAITGNVASGLLGRDSFQEVDITGITMPITKHNFIVKNVEDLADTVREAFRIARSGRPGPVLIDVPKDITFTKADFQPKEIVPAPKKAFEHPEAIRKAVKMIETSKRPLIYAGGGVVISGATQELITLAERAHIPVCTSIMGLGGFPNDHPQYMGLIGMHGSYESNMAASECDLIIALGARFSDRVAGNRKLFAPKANILHIDIDAAEINKNVATRHYLVGDLSDILSQINAQLTECKHLEWEKKVAEWKQVHTDDAAEGTTLRPKFILDTLRAVTERDAIIATDVGQHQIWTAQYFPFYTPRTFISSCGLGTMGYGLGAAIGAKTAMPDRQVVLVSGDGSFHMNCNELATAVSYNVPVVVLVFNNSTLGMVRQWQKLYYDNRFSSTTHGRVTDYVKLAEAYGATGMRVTEREELKPALEKALAVGGPVVIDCVISIDENVLPMISPGETVDSIITRM